MAIGSAKSSTPPPTRQSAAKERLIQQQLKRTMLHVKLVDVFGGVMILATIVLVLALAAAIIDAWVFDLGFAGRLAALLLIAGIAVTYLIVSAPSLLLRRINPEFAARMIEDSKPSLKNSLINLLTFRRTASARAHQVVYQALEDQAASDLADLPVESAVDRSKLIVAGYILAGVMVICGLYKVLSPKDPFQTFARIAAPFSRIDRPSRVEILEVEPGDQEVFHGDIVPVRARIDGVKDSDQVEILYSTADGQLVDQQIVMSSSGSSMDFEAELAPGGSGIQQDLDYRIKAGDAVSQLFRVTVLAAPTIVVESVQYDYPDYTNRPAYVAEGQGDVRGLEGTRVTIRCRANHPIKHASIELEPPASGAAGAAVSRTVKKTAMQVQGFEASGQFQLRLHADRRTPLFSSYRVHFVTKDGFANKQPIDHRIEVLPDLPPEIKILAPTRNVIQVPENAKANIEVRAIDPDYGLRRITLRAVAGDATVLESPLLDDPAGHIGQVVASFDFVPRELGLSAGTEVRYWAIGEDNRTSPLTGQPQPGSTRTRPDHFIQIVEPEKTIEPAGRGDVAKDSAAGDPRKDLVEDPDGDQPASDSASSVPDGLDSSTPSDASTAEDASTDPSDDENTAAERASEGQSGSQPGGDSASGSSSSAAGEKSGSSAGEPEQGKPSSSGSGTASSGQSGSSSGGNSNSDGAGKPGSTGGQASPGSGGGQTSSGGQQEPLHPGEVFEKVLTRMDEDEQSGGGQGSSAAEGSKPAAQQGSNQGDAVEPGDGSAAGGGGSESGQPPNGGSASQQQQSEGGQAGQQPGEGPAAGQQSQPGQGSQSQGSQSQGSQSQGSQSQGGSSQQPSNSGQQSNGAGQQSSGQSPSDAQSGGGQQSATSEGSPQDQQGQQSGGGGEQDQSGGSSGQQQGGQQSGGQQSGGQQSGGQQSGGQQSGGQQSGGQQSGGQQSGGQQSGGQQSGGQQSGGQQSGGQQSGGRQQQQQASGGGSPQQGGGSQGQQQQGQQQQGQQQQGQQQQGQQSGGQGQSGQKGAGNQPQQGGGSPAAQGQNQDRQKRQSGGGQQQAGGPKSPGQSQNQSNSQGDEQGDRSGGGGSGGGQSSGQSGSDSSGGSTPSDEGGQASQQRGGQDSSTQPGDSQPAGQPTGRSGSEAGAGSETRRSSTGNQNVSQPGGAGDRLGSPQTGGGGNPNSTNTEHQPDDYRPVADEANLEYARRATDLALEYLRDQKEDPEKGLLDELNWSADELRDFVERWDALKRNAREDASEGRRELDEALRSLGLRPTRDKRRGGGATDDNFTDYGDAGQISRPPIEHLEKFNAFLKGTARVEK